MASMPSRDPDTAGRGRPDVALRAFAAYAVGTFVMYGFGSVTPLLRTELGIADWLIGVHASAIAIGLIVWGVLGNRVARRLGGIGPAERLAEAGVALAAVAMALAPHPIASLLASLLVGLCAGVIISWVNQRLAQPGGRDASVALARANLVAISAALTAPIAIAAVALTGIVSGRDALLFAVPVVLVLELTRRAPFARAAGPGEASPDGDRIGAEAPARPVAAHHVPEPPLPGAFWRAWLVIVLVVGVEFSIVYWGSTLIALRTGVSASDATGIGAAFLAGMIASRTLLSAGVAAGRSRVGVMVVALVIALAGVSATWLATTAAVGGLGLFLAGLGVGPLYPVGVGFTLGLAPEAPDAATTRATLASGVAILLAPLVLSLVAEVAGIANAWPLVAGFALAALAVLATLRVPAPVPQPA